MPECIAGGEQIGSRFRRMPFPCGAGGRDVAVVPTVKGVVGFKYGEHAYYRMDASRKEGACVRVGHGRVIAKGFAPFRAACDAAGIADSLPKLLAGRYHYGFSVLEQVMLMTVPHTVTWLGGCCYAINLWSWFGFLVVDFSRDEVAYHRPSGMDAGSVLGSQQWFEPSSGQLMAMSYPLKDSLARIAEPTRTVPVRLFRHVLGESGSETVWQGELADYVHDLIVNETRQYGVVCELGMYEKAGALLPSKVLILDLVHGHEWVLEQFIVAAHAVFDPTDPTVVYFSNHNFQFHHSSLGQLLRRGSYAAEFLGPAAIYKYRLTAAGPQELGVFTQDDFFRLTNMHVCHHRGRKLIVAMGFPDVVFLIDAETMAFIRTIKVVDGGVTFLSRGRERALIGTIGVSSDGETLFVQTRWSFQMIDLASGEADYQYRHLFSHTCFNHMLVHEAGPAGGGTGE
jgi:hypothetical protein